MATEAVEKPTESKPEETLADFEEKILFSWESLERVHKIRGKDFYSTIIVLGVLVSIIMFFIEGLTPVLVIWAVIFVAWVISKTPPSKTEHQITSLGIRTGGGLYRFSEMLFFWVEEKWGEKILKVALARGFPNQLNIIISPNDDLKIRNIMVQRGIQLSKPEPTFLDKAVKWFSEKIPFE